MEELKEEVKEEVKEELIEELKEEQIEELKEQPPAEPAVSSSTTCCLFNCSADPGSGGLPMSTF